ncbi:late embryogenesis abundant protein 1-like [Dorcoceras hygrometricum]|uniref:Late embryogenesis abundant protein 1-like n=1 Tax=Dorcoceras hygrometricum TaxID=472368 RepID=A0A2Z7A515_9LAMI|nr:late embryogenesis abundant protein 1-like [Dorcoceras hygrometricum]
MSSGQFNAGQARGQAQAKTEEWVESAKDTASKAHDKVCETAGQTQQQAQRSKDENANFLQQTGEQVVHMAQGAIDGVKNTLGMGDKK